LKKLVAILVPLYNGSEFVDSIVESISIQDYPKLKIYFFDDGSSDDTMLKIKSSARSLSVNYKTFGSPTNNGVGRALRALHLSAELDGAEIGIIFSQDDSFPASYVSQMVKALEKKDTVLSYSRLEFQDSKGTKLKGKVNPIWIAHFGKYKTALLLATNHITAPGSAYRIDQMDEMYFIDSNTQVQDWIQWLYLSLSGKFKLQRNQPARYTRHENSLSFGASRAQIHLQYAEERARFIRSRQFVSYIENMRWLEKLIFLTILRVSIYSSHICSHNRIFLDEVKTICNGEPLNILGPTSYLNCGLNGSVIGLEEQVRSPKIFQKSDKPTDGPVRSTFYIVRATLLFHVRSMANLPRNIFRLVWLKFPIIIYSVGGYGAQLSALSYAVWIEQTHGRKVHIRFTEKNLTYYPLKLSQSLVNYQISIISHPTKKVDFLEPKKIKQDFLGWIKDSLRWTFKKFGVIVGSEHLSKQTMSKLRPWTHYLPGYHTDYQVFSDTWEEVSKKLSKESFPNFTIGAGSLEGVAVHWRLGDYLQNSYANETHGTISAPSILKAISDVVVQKGGKVHIFTDSPEIVTEMLGSRISDYDFVLHSGDILDDLYLMSRFETFIGSHSSISIWCALAMLKNNPRSQILLPDKWFKVEPNGFSKVEDGFLKPQEIFKEIQEYAVDLT
jgi:glycosyltransferase involved in cell wall biosynthesis